VIRVRRLVAAAVLFAAGMLTGGAEAVTPGWPVEPGVAVTVATAGDPRADDRPDGDGSLPTRVRIPTIRVDSPLDPLGTDDAGALRAPTNFAHAGWYADGTVPGDVGPAVIAGHVDSASGPAVFLRLYQLRPGDPVQVRRGHRWLEFRVVSTARYPKNGFPTADVYGPTPDAQLRLITCGGSFDTKRRSYVDNVVVDAVAVRLS
jgi:LPXTG-site transpeptidase (sortase) family protein